MSKIVVKMTWSQGKNQWHMELPNGIFVQELYYCENLQKLFPNLDKEKSKLYTIDVKELNK